MTTPAPERRRPVPLRETTWVRAVARQLADWGVRPNMISAVSLIASAVAALAIIVGQERIDGSRTFLFVLAGVAIQLRLFSNLIDGLVAVEGGRGGPTGELWNELPDRLSDALCLVAAGYATGPSIGGAPLGWLAALLAVLTAYVRALGTSVGASAQFGGPMAKQRRMDVLTLACLVSIFEPSWSWRGESLAIGLAIIVAGSAVTIINRTLRIAAELRAR